MLPEVPMIGSESKYNFETLMKAAINDDVALVSCKDAKGRNFDVLAVVAHDASNFNNYVYIPFAIMVNPSIYSLLNKIHPPETLIGEWGWSNDDDPST